MGVMILDAVRDKMLFGSEGVPLGLMLSKAHFVDIRYIFRADFRAGLSGFRSLSTRVLFALLIVVCSLVAVLVGPAAALLMTPVWHEMWPAGGTYFWFNGDLTPTRLDATSTPPYCTQQALNASLVAFPGLDDTSCPWGGYRWLAEELAQPARGAEMLVGYNNGYFRQNIKLGWASVSDINMVRVFATAGNVAIGAFSHFLSQLGWCHSGPSHWTYYREANGTKASVQSMVPLVRTRCMISTTDIYSGPRPADVPEDVEMLPVSYPSSSDL